MATTPSANQNTDGTWDSSVRSSPADESSRIRNLKYPLAGGNSHFVRFFINVAEESKLVRTNKVATTGYVDYSEQDRAFKNQTSADALTTGAGIAAGTALASVGGSTAVRSASAVKALFKSKGALGAKTAAMIGAAGTVGAAIAGYAAVNGTGVGQAVIDNFKLTQRLKRLAASICLYTPDNIRANYSFEYSMPDDLLVHLAQQDNYDAIKKGLKSMTGPLADADYTDFSSVTNAISQSGKSAASAVGSVGRILGASNQTASMLSRTAANKKKDIMFQHVGNRTFNFQYTFAPRDANEASEVDDIIFMFKYFAHPEMLQGYGNFLYLYPAEFDIEYGMIAADGLSDTQNKFINKISSCVLTAFDVNYAPRSSFQSLENGEPPIIELSMTFQEIETLHRDRIAKGY